MQILIKEEEWYPTYLVEEARGKPASWCWEISEELFGRYQENFRDFEQIQKELQEIFYRRKI